MGTGSSIGEGGPWMKKELLLKEGRGYHHVRLHLLLQREVRVQRHQVGGQQEGLQGGHVHQVVDQVEAEMAML